MGSSGDVSCPSCGAPNSELNVACARCGEKLLEAAARPSREQDDAFIGRRIDRYDILARLGRGGMGIVYRARDTTLGRPVALKFLAQPLLREPAARARFLREARAASALDHPNIAALHEVAEHDGSLFIVMALYEGETLKERIARGPLPLEEFRSIFVQMLAAVSVAHAAGIVHRDIKPANVMLTSEGTVKLLDFGVAQISSSEEGESTLTANGELVGTVAYMAPEQLRCARVDARADLWALGAVAYEMLAGVAPFAGESRMVTGSDILMGEPPPLAKRRGDVSFALRALIDKLLKKDPADRFATAADTARALDAIESLRETSSEGATLSPSTKDGGRGPATFPLVTPTHPRRRAWVFGAAVGLAAITGFSAIALLGGARDGQRRGIDSAMASASAPSEDHPAVTYGERRLATSSAGSLITTTAISQDGKWVVYVDGGAMWVVAAEGGDRRPVEPPPGMDLAQGATLAFLPDGATLALAGRVEGREELWRVRLDGGPAARARELRGLALERPLCVSPDGKLVVFETAKGLVVGAIDGDDERLVVTRARDDIFSPATFSPRGDELAVVRARAEGEGTAWLEVASLDGNRSRRLIEDPRLASRDLTMAVAWPDPKRVLVGRDAPVDDPRRGEILEIGLDDAGGTAGPPRTIASAEGATIFSIQAARGRILYRALIAAGDIYTGRLADGATRVEGELERRTTEREDRKPLGFLPDGRVVFLGGATRDGAHDVFARAAGRADDLVAQGVASAPTVGPTGDVFFARAPSEPGAPCEIVRASPVAGRFQEARVATTPRTSSPSCDVAVYCPRASPTRCVLRELEAMATHISWLDLMTGKKGAPIADENRGRTSWAVSPNAELLASPSGSNGITLLSTAGGSKREVRVSPAGEVQNLAFAADGRALLLTGMNFPDARYAVTSVDLDGRGRIVLRSAHEWMSSPRVAADGRTFAIHKRTFSRELRILEPR